MARIVRPVRGKLHVTLPYQPGGANYGVLKAICGGRTRPEWNREHRYFEVAREHLAKLIHQLPNAIGQRVEVVLHGATQTKCVSACWAANPDTRWDCVCSCAGSNHGTGHPLPTQVSADLAIQTDYTTERYVINPSD
jgi:hypothetical protein